jgi:hypothetical protein
MTLSSLLRRSSAVFRPGVVLFYWLLLPVLLALVMAWALSAAMQPASVRNWLGLAALVALTALIAWRLWLNRRASGLTGALPGPARLLKVFLPLGLLALFGLLALMLGLMWTAIGVVAARDAALAHSLGSPEGSFSLAQIGMGCLAAMIGLALCAPFWRRLIARVPAASAEASEPAVLQD